MSVKAIVLVLLACISLVCSANTKPKLIFVETIFRHGQKYPEKSPDPQINKHYLQSHMALGELINEGKALQYLMGKKMYQVYWKRLFGGTPYERHLNLTKVTAKSINFSRIIESGEAHLFGMFEGLAPLTISPKQAQWLETPYPGVKVKPGYVFGQRGRGFHTIPITLMENCKFSVILVRDEIVNLNTKSQLAEKFRVFPPFRAVLAQFAQSIHLSNKTIEFGNFHIFYMNEICQIAVGKRNSIMLKNPQAARTLNMLHTLELQVKYYTNQIQLKTDTTAVFQQIIDNVRKYLAHRNTSQWVVFSSQELIMGNILAAFKMWTVECILENYEKNITNPKDCIIDFPPFGTVMAFEVYEYPDSKVTFKFNYNGRHLSLPLCGQKECEFSALQAWFEKWKVPDDQAGCLSTNEHIKEQMAKANDSAADIKTNEIVDRILQRLSLNRL